MIRSEEGKTTAVNVAARVLLVSLATVTWRKGVNRSTEKNIRKSKYVNCYQEGNPVFSTVAFDWIINERINEPSGAMNAHLDDVVE